MKQYILRNHNKIYLNSFHPLCINALGEEAIKKFNHPPFIDASCRREPDLENKFPTISSLCRQHIFAPRLVENDIVVYISVKRLYGSDKLPVNKLIAILKVIRIFDTHKEGYDWYKSNGYSIPSNCLVDGNPPIDFDHTAGNFKTKTEIRTFQNRDEGLKKIISKRLLDVWDKTYKTRIDNLPILVQTEPIYLELYNPISLTKLESSIVFGGKIPNTRNPPAISLDNLKRLASIAGLELLVPQSTQFK